MTALIANVTQSSDSFGQWLNKTNQIATVIRNTAVTTDSNTAVGNAAITGTFTANTLMLTTPGFSSSNVIANNIQILIRSSSTANTIVNDSGMIINGTTLFTEKLLSMGNTRIRAANVSSNSAYFTDQLSVGTYTYVTNSTVYTSYSNNQYEYTQGWHVIGDAEANTYINRNGVQIYGNPTGQLVQNSKMTSTDLWIQNVHCNFLDLTGSAQFIFQGNTWFKGQNNYFVGGLTSGGNVHIVGKGEHFSHTAFGDTDGGNQPTIGANTVFVYNGNGGSARLTRNVMQNVTADDNADYITNTKGEAVWLKDGRMDFYTYYNGTPGTATYTKETVLSVSNSQILMMTSNLGINTTNTAAGPITVAGASQNNIQTIARFEGRVANTTNQKKALDFKVTTANTSGTTEWWIATTSEGTEGSIAIAPGSVPSLIVDRTGATTLKGTLSVLGVTDFNNSVKINNYGLAVGNPANVPVGGSGTIRAGDNITAFYSSDRRLKNNIVNIESPLEKLSKINGVTFDWIDEHIARQGGEDGTYVRKHDVGVIAQEIQQILPEIVAERPDGHLAVRYEMIVPLLIEAIKQLKSEVDSLKNGN